MKQLKINQKITARESHSMDRYLREIGKYELITAEEEVLLAQRIKKGDKIALDKLAKANLRFVVSVAKQYQNSSLSLGDLINEGNHGLMKAAARFDETRGFKFISYAVWWIRQSIMQALVEQSRVVRLPVNRVSGLTKISKMSSSLEQKLQREPTVEELADALELPPEEIVRNFQISGPKVSVDAPFLSGEGNLLEVLSDDQLDLPDTAMMQESLGTEVRRALATLTNREAEIMECYFGLNGKESMTLSEIGLRFSLTRERVRQIKEKATRRLRHSARSASLKTYL